MPDDRRTVEREESAEAPSGQVVDAERRRGRGARSNRAGRFESELRETFDDGWESLGELEPFKTDVLPGDGQEHHLHQRQPRHQLRAVHQPLSRLRARLHLLLRAADPLPTSAIRPGSTSRPSSTPRSTPPSCWSASSPIPATCRSTSRSAPSPIPTSRSSASTASPARSWRCWSAPAIPSASSPSRRSWCATSTSSRAWRAAASSRWRSPSPRSTAASPARWSRARPPRRRRLEAIRALAQAGVPVAVMTAPIIPAINDSEIERILAAAREAGATEAGYVLLRLPLELKELFREWLAHRVPGARGAHHQHSALHARRQGLHARMARPPARPRPLRRADRRQIPVGHQALGPQRAHLQAAHRPVPAPRRRKAASCPLL